MIDDSTVNKSVSTAFKRQQRTESEIFAKFLKKNTKFRGKLTNEKLVKMGIEEVRDVERNMAWLEQKGKRVTPVLVWFMINNGVGTKLCSETWDKEITTEVKDLKKHYDEYVKEFNSKSNE